MWFKLFALLRLPLSVICLFGCATALGVWSNQGMVLFGGALFLGALVFLGVVSVKLSRLRQGALGWAKWLLLLEALGAFLSVGGAGMSSGRNKVAIWGLVFGLWVLPNWLIIYSQRRRFTVAKEKPGL